MKNKFPIPVIGVIEPGIRAALEVTQNKNIGVILTPASAKMGAYKNVFDVIFRNSLDCCRINLATIF